MGLLGDIAGIFGGGGGESTSATTITDDSTFAVTDDRLIEGDGVIQGNVNLRIAPPTSGNNGNGNGASNVITNISQTDFGAINAGREVSLGAIEGNVLGTEIIAETLQRGVSDLTESVGEIADSAASTASNIAGQATSTARTIAGQALDVAKGATQDEQARTIQFLIIGTVVAVSIFALIKLKARG